MDGIQYGYDELINAVFEEAYDNLVSDYRRAKAFHRLALCEKGSKKRDAEKDEMLCIQDALYLEGWFREVLPCWRDIAPDRIIRRAREEADEPRARGQTALKSLYGRRATKFYDEG